MAAEPLTIEDFEALPDALAEDHELEDGKLVDVSGNTAGHNILRGLIELILLQFVREHKLGMVLAEQEYEFGENAYGPDVSFFGNHKRGLIELGKRVQSFVPDLAVEIISQNERFERVWKKRTRYRTCGVAEVWLISLATREIFVESEGRSAVLSQRDTLSTPLLPGLTIDLRALWSEIPESDPLTSR